jgi:hypothetical protein
MNTILRLKAKKGKPFISQFGSEHADACLCISTVSNYISIKKLDILFQVYNSENDIDKQPIHVGFLLSFDERETAPTITNPMTGEVLRWGTPTYTEVLEYFDVVDQGIILKKPEVEMWFLNRVTFLNEPLINNWDIA